MKILYLHGFSSAGSTGTATELRNHFYPLGISVLSPDIPVYPKEALPFIEAYVKENLNAEEGDIIVGTSMGAMYTEMMKGFRRIMVNPSFQISRSLTFNHLGKNVAFLNPRQDGAKQFKVDKEMVAQFKALEKDRLLKGITADEKKLVWGLFGERDRLVNFQKEYQKAYGKEHFATFDGEHHLNGVVLKKVVIPLLHNIIGIEG